LDAIQRAAAGGRVLQYLLITVGVAQRDYRTPADELVELLRAAVRIWLRSIESTT